MGVSDCGSSYSLFHVQNPGKIEVANMMSFKGQVGKRCYIQTVNCPIRRSQWRETKVVLIG